MPYDTDAIRRLWVGVLAQAREDVDVLALLVADTKALRAASARARQGRELDRVARKARGHAAARLTSGERASAVGDRVLRRPTAVGGR